MSLRRHVPVSLSNVYRTFYGEKKLLDRRAQTHPASNPPPSSNAFSATSVSSAGITEEWQSSPTDPSLTACPICAALVGSDLSIPVRQAESFASSTSCSTDIYRCAPLLPPSHRPLFHSSPIPRLSLAQRFLNCREKTMSGAVLFELALVRRSLHWRNSNTSLHWWFWAISKGTLAPCFFPKSSFIRLLSLPHRAN